ncbi:MAG TPA: DnaJ C-terminal domain-containing protein [Steroidobacteraceae bacterium]|jgi:curved DNA-binding protein
MQYKDYYQTLGVTRDADAEEIKRSYRKLARKYHPDVSKEKNAEERFKEVAEAYEVLRDSDKRAAYDQLGREYRSGQQFRPPPDWAQRFSAGGGQQRFSDLHGFSDFFSSLFGGGFAGGGFSPGAQPAQESDAGFLDITVEEAFAGTKRRVTLNENRTQRQVDVQVPAGVADGQTLRIPGLGGRGSLLFKVRIREHHLYERDGRDVRVELPLAPWEAALGTKVAVPTLGGTVELTVPAGAQSGQKLRLRARGFPGTPPGDQFVIIKVMTPPADTQEARAAYERMKLELPFNPREDWP